MPQILLLLGIIAITLALRSYQHPIPQKLSALGILAAAYFAGLAMTGNRAAGAAFATSLLLLPWLDLITRIRKLTLPVERNLRHKSPPGSGTFPALHELTDEVEGSGFEHIDDAGWDWEEHQQFFRLFYKSDERVQAAICLVDQEEFAFYYLSLSSRGKNGTVWTTWNYPFSYSLQTAPQSQVNRVRADLTFLELFDSHRRLLHRHGIAADKLEELDAESIPVEIQKDLRTQVAHNLATGVLARAGETEVRYTWRGLVFLWWQFLRDLVRFT